MITPSEVTSIGKLTRTHGTQGELQCLLSNHLWDTAQPSFIILRLEEILTPFRIVDWRDKGPDTILLTLANIDSENTALPLVGSEVFMLRRDLQETDEETITWQSLTDYRVLDEDQGDLGKVEQVDESTINTLLTLTGGTIIPIHEDFILSILPKEHILHIRLPFQL